VGLEPEELIELASIARTKSALKVSRRDLGYICGRVNTGQRVVLASEQTLRNKIGVSGETHPWWHYYFRDDGVGAPCWDQNLWYWWARQV
jgi:hypothetical protein